MAGNNQALSTADRIKALSSGQKQSSKPLSTADRIKALSSGQKQSSKPLSTADRIKAIVERDRQSRAKLAVGDGVDINQPSGEGMALGGMNIAPHLALTEPTPSITPPNPMRGVINPTAAMQSPVAVNTDPAHKGGGVEFAKDLAVGAKDLAVKAGRETIETPSLYATEIPQIIKQPLNIPVWMWEGATGKEWSEEANRLWPYHPPSETAIGQLYGGVGSVYGIGALMKLGAKYLGKAGGLLAGGMATMGMGSGEVARDARETGGRPATGSERAVGALGGLLNYVPIPAIARGKVTAAIGAEGVTEFAENTVQNIIASDFGDNSYDPRRPASQGGGEALLLGGAIGGLAAGAMKGANAIKNRANLKANIDAHISNPESQQIISQASEFASNLQGDHNTPLPTVHAEPVGGNVSILNVADRKLKPTAEATTPPPLGDTTPQPVPLTPPATPISPVLPPTTVPAAPPVKQPLMALSSTQEIIDRAAAIDTETKPATPVVQNHFTRGSDRADLVSEAFKQTASETDQQRYKQSKTDIAASPTTRLPAEGSIASGWNKHENVFISATGQKANMSYRIVPAATMIDTDDANAIEAFQPREELSVENLIDMENNFDPDELKNGRKAGDSAMLITNKGFVVAGNHRSRLLKNIYGLGSRAGKPEKAKAYKDMLTSIGFVIVGIKNPVLVRVLDKSMSFSDIQALANTSNSNTSAQLKALEDAHRNAKKITDKVKDFSSITDEDFYALLDKNERNRFPLNHKALTEERQNAMMALVLGNEAVVGVPIAENAVMQSIGDRQQYSISKESSRYPVIADALAPLHIAMAKKEIRTEYGLASAIVQAANALHTQQNAPNNTVRIQMATAAQITTPYSDLRNLIIEGLLYEDLNRTKPNLDIFGKLTGKRGKTSTEPQWNMRLVGKVQSLLNKYVAYVKDNPAITAGPADTQMNLIPAVKLASGETMEAYGALKHVIEETDGFRERKEAQYNELMDANKAAQAKSELKFSIAAPSNAVANNPANHPKLKGTKVVDENGKPELNYHGSNDKKLGADFNRSVGWFSPNREVAEGFTQLDNPQVDAVYLGIKNPIDIYNFDGSMTAEDVNSILTKAGIKRLTESEIEHIVSIDSPFHFEFAKGYLDGATAPYVFMRYKDELSKAGYDGIIGEDGSVGDYSIPFSADQIINAKDGTTMAAEEQIKFSQPETQIPPLITKVYENYNQVLIAGQGVYNTSILPHKEGGYKVGNDLSSFFFPDGMPIKENPIRTKLKQESLLYETATDFSKAYSASHLMDLSDPNKHRMGRLFDSGYGEDDVYLNAKIASDRFGSDLGIDIESADQVVTIYRSANKSQKKILPGDFVSLNPDYADSHNRGKLLKLEVPAKDVVWLEVDANEWAYSPESIRGQTYNGGLKQIFNEARKEKNTRFSQSQSGIELSDSTKERNQVFNRFVEQADQIFGAGVITISDIASLNQQLWKHRRVSNTTLGAVRVSADKITDTLYLADEANFGTLLHESFHMHLSRGAFTDADVEMLYGEMKRGRWIDQDLLSVYGNKSDAMVVEEAIAGWIGLYGEAKGKGMPRSKLHKKIIAFYDWVRALYRQLLGMPRTAADFVRDLASGKFANQKPSIHSESSSIKKLQELATADKDYISQQRKLRWGPKQQGGWRDDIRESRVNPKANQQQRSQAAIEFLSHAGMKRVAKIMGMGLRVGGKKRAYLPKTGTAVLMGSEAYNTAAEHPSFGGAISGTRIHIQVFYNALAKHSKTKLISASDYEGLRTAAGMTKKQFNGNSGFADLFINELVGIDNNNPQFSQAFWATAKKNKQLRRGAVTMLTYNNRIYDALTKSKLSTEEGVAEWLAGNFDIGRSTVMFDFANSVTADMRDNITKAETQIMDSLTAVRDAAKRLGHGHYSPAYLAATRFVNSGNQLDPIATKGIPIAERDANGAMATVGMRGNSIVNMVNVLGGVKGFDGYGARKRALEAQARAKDNKKNTLSPKQQELLAAKRGEGHVEANKMWVQQMSDIADWAQSYGFFNKKQAAKLKENADIYFPSGRANRKIDPSQHRSGSVGPREVPIVDALNMLSTWNHILQYNEMIVQFGKLAKEKNSGAIAQTVDLKKRAFKVGLKTVLREAEKAIGLSKDDLAGFIEKHGVDEETAQLMTLFITDTNGKGADGIYYYREDGIMRAVKIVDESMLAALTALGKPNENALFQVANFQRRWWQSPVTHNPKFSHFLFPLSDWISSTARSGYTGSDGKSKRNPLMRLRNLPQSLRDAGHLSPANVLRIMNGGIMAYHGKGGGDQIEGSLSGMLRMLSEQAGSVGAAGRLMGGRHENIDRVRELKIQEQSALRNIGTKYMGSVMRFENLFRVYHFKKFKEAGFSDSEAAVRADDAVSNFSKRGAHQIIQFAEAAFPFAGATKASLATLTDIARDKNRLIQFGLVMGAYTVLVEGSALVWNHLLMGLPDDETAEASASGTSLYLPTPMALEHFIKTGEMLWDGEDRQSYLVRIKLPKSWETGAGGRVAGTIAKTSMGIIPPQEGFDRVLANLKHFYWEPSFGYAEAYYNIKHGINTWGDKVLSPSQERLLPEAQIARNSVSRAVRDEFGISPAKFENAINQLVPVTGEHAIALSSLAIDIVDGVVSPAEVLQNIFTAKPPASRRARDVYKIIKGSSLVANSVSAMEVGGRPDLIAKMLKDTAEDGWIPKPIDSAYKDPHALYMLARESHKVTIKDGVLRKLGYAYRGLTPAEKALRISYGATYALFEAGTAAARRSGTVSVRPATQYLVKLNQALDNKDLGEIRHYAKIAYRRSRAVFLAVLNDALNTGFNRYINSLPETERKLLQAQDPEYR